MLKWRVLPPRYRVVDSQTGTPDPDCCSEGHCLKRGCRTGSSKATGPDMSVDRCHGNYSCTQTGTPR